MTEDEKESAIVAKLERVFFDLRSGTFPYNWEFLRRKKLQENKTVIEVYVVGSLVVSILLTFIWPVINSATVWPVTSLSLIIAVIIVLWCGFRVYEIFVVQANLLFFDWYRFFTRKRNTSKRQYSIRGLLRLTILLLVNYADVIFLFSICYQVFSSWFNFGEALTNPIVAVNFSFFIMTTFGRSDVVIMNNFGYVLTMIQASIGLFMALFILSRFIGLLPKPPSSDRIEQGME